MDLIIEIRERIDRVPASINSKTGRQRNCYCAGVNPDSLNVHCGICQKCGKRGHILRDGRGQWCDEHQK